MRLRELKDKIDKLAAGQARNCQVLLKIKDINDYMFLIDVEDIVSDYYHEKMAAEGDCAHLALTGKDAISEYLSLEDAWPTFVFLEADLDNSICNDVPQ